MEKWTAPEHLKDATRAWVEDISASYALESHHLRLLVLAGESWDRICQAREQVDREGLTIEGRFGVKTHPAVLIEKDNKILFARLVRELNLDESGPDDPRIPRRGKV